MTSVTVHITVAVWSTPVTEQDHHLVKAFRIKAPEIPLHGLAFQVGFGIPFLSVDKITELFRVFNKKHGGIVPHQVPVTLFRVKFNGESTRISFCISTSLFSTNGRKADKDPAFISDFTENPGF